MNAKEIFFDKVSDFYDEMIDPGKSIFNKKKFFEKYNPSKAADLGCGSGNDTIALAETGFIVDAFDPSIKMVQLVKNKSAIKKLNVNVYNYSIADIPNKFYNKYSFIVCFGNTFANISKDEFEESISKIYSLLRKDGIAFIQLMNFTKLLQNQKKIIGISKKENLRYIRFYEYNKNLIYFNILVYNDLQLNEHKIFTTKLYPFTQRNFQKTFKKISIKNYSFYSNLKLEEFDPESSESLVIKIVRN